MPIPHHTFDFDGADTFLCPQDPWTTQGVTPIEWLTKNYAQYLYRQDHIIRNAEPYRYKDGPNSGGIYFLIAGSNIVYAGKSNTIYLRLAQHFDKGVEFTHYWCFGGIPEMFLEYVELFYLYTLRPTFNIKYPPLFEPARNFVHAHKSGTLTYAPEHC